LSEILRFIAPVPGRLTGRHPLREHPRNVIAPPRFDETGHPLTV
jgi:hypothetical protein